MIILGVVLLLLGFLPGAPAIGVIVLVIGLVLLLLGHVGRPVGGRGHYW